MIFFKRFMKALIRSNVTAFKRDSLSVCEAEIAPDASVTSTRALCCLWKDL